MSSMTLSEELKWRGFVNQTTLENTSQLDKKKFKLYFGVDPSSDSMTVGNLASAMMVKTFLRHGHHVTLLIGGATGIIGDPSGKDAERNLLTLDQVAHNKQAIIGQYHQLFGQRVHIVDNYDWFKNIGYLDFLREVGKHFSLTPLLQRDYIATRIGGSGISYAEFSYTLIQGYDFYHLFTKYDIDLQLCGSDQWGNALSGVELIRRKTGQEAHVYSMPLIVNKATGKKFGKSEDDAVWLDDQKTSVYRFYQFWLNVDDDSVGEYLKIYTELDEDEIAHIMADFHGNKGGRLAQKRLAFEVTQLVHGQKRAEAVRRVTGTLFGEVDIDELNRRELDMLKDELPYVRVNQETGLAKVLVMTSLAKSNSEALRFVASGAIALNGNKVDPAEQYPLRRGVNLLKRGKNNFAIVECK